MCGITGFYTSQTDTPRTQMHFLCQDMVSAISHRGPDAHGVWQDPDVGLALGHARLSILDLTDAGAQPMSSPSGRYVIVYNGEIYNFTDIYSKLEARHNVRFRSRSDTEVLLAAVDLWGVNKALQEINGMYAFALWDRKARELHLVRDRMGKKPLYVGWAAGDFVFGSELKALRKYPGFHGRINHRALAQMLQGAAVAAPETIYDGVWTIPAGHRMTLTQDMLEAGCGDLRMHMAAYWQHLDQVYQARTVPFVGSEEDAVLEFETLLRTCVKERMIADVPLGAFLSGGLDSSLVVAMMQAQQSRPVQTFSVGFDSQGYNEAPYAKAVAEYLGTDHHELSISSADCLQMIEHLPQVYDEPFADISALPTYVVSGFARRMVTVALSGDGGDEMLGGYNRHIQGPELFRRSQVLPRWMRGVVSEAVQSVPVGLLDKFGRGHPQFGMRMHKAARMMQASSARDVYEKLAYAFDAPPLAIMPHEETGFFDYASWQPDELSAAEKFMYWDSLTYLPNDILVKVDRASMAHGLECRAPLLDARLYQFCWSLPEHMKVRNTPQGRQGKWLLRQVLAKHVPPRLFERPKQGFTMPIGQWLREDLRDWAENLLDAKTLEAEGLLNARRVRKIWQAHLNGQGYHDQQLWAILMFRAWHQKWS